jgi:hypothetical protein
MATKLSQSQEVALSKRFGELRDHSHSVADLGQAVLDYALSEAAAYGYSADGEFEVPITITLTVKMSDLDATAPLTCVEACVKGGSTKRLCAWICNPSPIIDPPDRGVS